MNIDSPADHPLDRALRWAIESLAESSAGLPAAPPGWSIRAAAALASGDQTVMATVGLELRAAHSQYRADFDVLPALWEIRQALPHPLRVYVAAGVPVEHLLQPTQPPKAAT